MEELITNPLIQLLAAIIAAVIIALFKRAKELLEASGAKNRAEAIEAWNSTLYQAARNLVLAARDEALELTDEFVEGDKYDGIKHQLIDYGNTTLHRAGLADDLLKEEHVDALLRRVVEEVKAGL